MLGDCRGSMVCAIDDVAVVVIEKTTMLRELKGKRGIRRRDYSLWSKSVQPPAHALIFPLAPPPVSKLCGTNLSAHLRLWLQRW